MTATRQEQLADLIDRIGYEEGDGEDGLAAMANLIGTVRKAGTNGEALAAIATFRKAARMSAARAALEASVEPVTDEQREAERIERMNLEGMAGCMTMFRDDMIRLGIITDAVPPMFMTEAIKSAIVRADHGEFRDRIGVKPAGINGASCTDTRREG